MADLSLPPTKRCTKCGQEFPATLDNFYKSGRIKKDGSLGLHSWCRACFSAHTKPAAAVWNAAHRREATEAVKRHYQRNRAKLLLKHAAYRLLNREKARERTRQWRLRNLRRHAVNEQRRRAHKRNASGSHTVADVELHLKTQKGLCWWCGNPHGDNYHVDHRIALDIGGSNAPDNLCISCAFCNLSKGAKLPHEFNGRLL